MPSVGGGRRSGKGGFSDSTECRTECRNPLAQRRADPLLIGAAGAGGAQDLDRLGTAKGLGDLAKLGDASSPGQRLEGALDISRHRRRPAAQQQLSDTG